MRKAKNKTSRRVLQVLIPVVLSAIIIAAFIFVTHGRDIPVLQPHGEIAQQQLNLIIITTLLAVFVVVPVFILLFTIAWKYREGNKKADYQPEMDGNRWLEALWWGIPVLIIIALAIITAISTFALDPYKPLDSEKAPLKVQVISLEWKWLFIYPDQGIATVNYLNVPEDTPIEFTITSDAPMNSFWVPALGGQVYAMTGMSTKLHLIANKTGSYNGASANLSGDGFSGMRFVVNSQTEEEFNKWIADSKNSQNFLNSISYNELRKPSKNNAEKTYGIAEEDLYEAVIMKYMAPKSNTNTHSTEGGH